MSQGTAVRSEAKISASESPNYTPALVVLTSLFFMWGFITCLNDILIPHLKTVFSLNYTQAMLIQFTFFTAYFIVSLPSGFIVEKVGYKRGIVIGLIAAGIGCLMFYPAAGTRSYPIFLSALFVLASGITLLQVSANPYVAILGKPETASSRLTLTQAFNSLGTTVAPLFGSLLILSVAAKTTEELAALSPSDLTAYQLAEAASVQVPYLWLAAALFVIAAFFAIVKLPAIEATSGRPRQAPARAMIPDTRAPGSTGTWSSARWRSSSMSAGRLRSAASWLIFWASLTSPVFRRRKPDDIWRFTGAAPWSGGLSEQW